MWERDQGVGMRILAARFGDEASAESARARLRRRFDLGPSDVSVGPLGGADQPDNQIALLAGRFQDQRVEEVRTIIEGTGGEIVADLDEGWTRPRQAAAGNDRRWAASLDWKRAGGSSS